MDDKYWFPAKRYGWGWGLPQTWQGWVVVALFVTLFMVIFYGFPVGRDPILFAAANLALVGALVGICWVKGEPSRWRWGDDDPPPQC